MGNDTKRLEWLDWIITNNNDELKGLTQDEIDLDCNLTELDLENLYAQEVKALILAGIDITKGKALGPEHHRAVDYIYHLISNSPNDYYGVADLFKVKGGKGYE